MAFIIDAALAAQVSYEEIVGAGSWIDLEWSFPGHNPDPADPTYITDDETVGLRAWACCEFGLVISFGGTPAVRCMRDFGDEVEERYLDDIIPNHCGPLEELPDWEERQMLVHVWDWIEEDPACEIVRWGLVADAVAERGPVTAADVAAMLEPTWDSVEVLV